MDDTERPDPLLQQVPLIRNPSYRPPKPVTLNANYGKLISTLSTTAIPPKLSVSEQELQGWIAELEELRSQIDPKVRQEKVAAYHEWLKKSQNKVAPGFNFDVMTPGQNGESRTGA